MFYFIQLAILLICLFAHSIKTLGYSAGSNASEKIDYLTLLHLLLPGDIFRNCARLTQNPINLVKNLLITSNTKTLVVYGSLYIKKLSILVPSARVPILFSGKSIKVAYLYLYAPF